MRLHWTRSIPDTEAKFNLAKLVDTEMNCGRDADGFVVGSLRLRSRGDGRAHRSMSAGMEMGMGTLVVRMAAVALLIREEEDGVRRACEPRLCWV